MRPGFAAAAPLLAAAFAAQAGAQSFSIAPTTGTVPVSTGTLPTSSTTSFSATATSPLLGSNTDFTRPPFTTPGASYQIPTPVQPFNSPGASFGPPPSGTAPPATITPGMTPPFVAPGVIPAPTPGQPLPPSTTAPVQGAPPPPTTPPAAPTPAPAPARGTSPGATTKGRKRRLASAPNAKARSAALRSLDESNVVRHHDLAEEFMTRRKALVDSDEWRDASRSERKGKLKQLKAEFQERERGLREEYMRRRADIFRGSGRDELGQTVTQ